MTGVLFDIDDAARRAPSLQDRIFEISHDLLAEWNPAGQISRLNPAWERVLSHPPQTLLRRQLIELVHPDDVAATAAAFATLPETGILLDHEARFRHADGSWRTLSWNCTFNAHEDLVLGIARDLTEKQQVAALKATDERLRMALDAGGIGTFEWFPDSHDVIVSEQYCRLWGIEPRPVVTTDELVTYLHPDDFSRIGPAKLDSLATALDYTEYRAVRPDTGELRWLARRGKMVQGDDGGPPRLVGVLYDETERHRIEERLAHVLESVTDGFFGIDSEWRFTLFNRAAEQFFGSTREKMIGRNLWDLFPAALGSEFEAQFRRVMDKRVSLTFEVASLSSGDRTVEMRLSPKEGGGIAAAFSDITERKDAERYRDLLLHELNHRVKNTLAIVHAMAQQTFKGDAADPVARQSFEDRLTALAGAHDILTRQSWDSVELREVADRALAPFRRLGDERIVFDGPDVHLPGRTAVAFAMAIHELATNAAKYGALSNETGRILVMWDVDRADVEPRVKLLWQERGGPTVEAPSSRGFGSRMIERGLSAELRGDVRLSFDPEGLRCDIVAPLPRLTVEHGQPTAG